MRLYIAIFLNLFLITSCFTQSETIKEIYDLSEKIKYIDLDEFTYNRTDKYINKTANKAMVDFIAIAKLLQDNQINKLLLDENPKVRALGILSLYRTEDHKNILRIADFLTDTVDCYKPNPYPKFRSVHYQKQPTLEERLDKVSYLRISDIAKELITLYFNYSGHVYFNMEIRQFLIERRELTNTAGFLKFLKRKATSDVNPFQEEKTSLINGLKFRIDKIDNKIDKSIYKLYLSSDSYQLYSNAELLDEIKSLGKENIKLILQRIPPTKDPDLLNINNSEQHNWEYNRMCKLILLNSEHIFDDQDVNFLIKQEKIDREKTDLWGTTLFFPYWHIAAARIDSVNAKSYIVSCLEIFEGKSYYYERCELYAELIHLTRIRDYKFVSNWIFNSYGLNENSQERIEYFIRKLDEKEDLKFIKYLINSPKFESHLNVCVVVEIARQINKLYEEDIISNNLIKEIWHPFGVCGLEKSMAKALKEYPDETKKMLSNTKQLLNKMKTMSNKL